MIRADRLQQYGIDVVKTVVYDNLGLTIHIEIACFLISFYKAFMNVVFAMNNSPARKLLKRSYKWSQFGFEEFFARGFVLSVRRGPF